MTFCIYGYALNFLGHALGFFCGCRILLSTSWRFHRKLFKLPVRRQGDTLISTSVYARPPSHLWRRKRDTSLNQSRHQFLKVQTINVWNQRTRTHMCTWVKTGPIYGILVRIPRRRRLLRTVWVEILRKPRIPAAVVELVTGRLGIWNTRIY